MDPVTQEWLKALGFGVANVISLSIGWWAGARSERIQQMKVNK